MHQTTIIVFVKNPVLGRVKTRLAASVGDVRAMEIYLQLLDYTRDVLSQVQGVRRVVYYSDHVETDDEWSPIYFDKKVQSQEDLGHRMLTAIRQELQLSSNVIIIGSDCAQLTATHLQDAITALQDRNVVIGPSLDGGYYLLGLDGPYEALFEDVPWSTDQVLSITRKRAAEKNLTMTELPPLSDIDYIEDWEQHGL